MRFTIVTLGCKVNAYESNYYREQLEQAHHEYVEQDQPLDVCIINTCTVTNTAASKSRQKIHSLQKRHPDALFVVVGCYVQHANKEMREQLKVDLIIGAKYKNQLVEQIEEAFKNRIQKDLVEDVSSFTDFEEMPIHVFEDQHRAFLKIEDGCDQFCSYCAIPFARGRQRSLKKEKVIAIAKELSQKGHKEIVLTGIHTGRYEDGDTNLSSLLKDLIENTDSQVQFRISSIEITEIDNELIELMKASHRIAHHLHVPIQAGADATLKRMNRPYTVQEYKDKIAYIRSEVPDISISTDVMCGFVQESEEEFLTTMQTMKDCQFSFMHVFPYSKRDGTQAAKMPGHIHGSVRQQRVEKLLALSKELRIKDMQRFKDITVLIEKTDGKGMYSGYDEHYHPVHIYSSEKLEGRISVQWDRIENEIYIVDQEDKNAIK